MSKESEKKSSSKKQSFLIGAVVVLLFVVAIEGYYLFQQEQFIKNGPQSLIEKIQQSTSTSLLDRQKEGHPSNRDFFNEVRVLQDRIDRMFEESFSRRFHEPVTPYGEEIFHVQPRMDMKETEEGFLITCDVPGLEKSELQVHLEGNVLMIEGRRESQKEKKNSQKGWISRERQFGSFKRSISLPAQVDSSSVKARYRQGVLEIEVKKLEKTSHQKRKIDVI